VSESVLTAEHSRLHDDDVVTAADAAQIAQRSIRTIRRAYLSGKLFAHRDGNGRGVRIRYADLRAWLLAQPIHPARQWFPEGQKRAAVAFDAKTKARKFEGTADAIVARRATLAEYWAGPFADHLATKAPKTQRGYAQSYDLHIESRLGNVPLVRLDLKRVPRFAADLVRDGVKPSAADKSMSVLSAVLGLAEADGAVAVNPVPRLRRKRPKPRLVRPLAPATVEALRAKLDPRGAIIVSLLAYAGLRPHELTGLRWGDVLDVNLVVADGRRTTAPYVYSLR
jgi:hypothetical protein